MEVSDDEGAGVHRTCLHVHLARNDTAKPVTLYAMYLGLPAGKNANNPSAEPSGCSA